MSVFSEEPKEVKSNGTRKSKTIMDSFGLAYIVNLIRKGQASGMQRPGMTLEKFVEVCKIKPTQKQRETLSNFTHKLNQTFPRNFGVRVGYGSIGTEKALIFHWVNRKDGKKNKYEIPKAERLKYYKWLDAYIPLYEKTHEAQETLDNERDKKRPSKKIIEEMQAVIFGIELPEPPAVKVEVISKV